MSSATEAPVTVEISDVVPGSIKIPITELQVSDNVFDAFGRTDDSMRIKSLRTLKDGTVKIRREDGWVDYFMADSHITVIRQGA